MKENEKLFFRLCVKYGLRSVCPVRIREIIGILYHSGVMHYKRCWYLLEKWAGLGFYEWGVAMDLGWLMLEKLPQRYALLLEQMREEAGIVGS